MGIRVRPRWHFNKNGNYTGQSIDPGIIGWLYFIGPFISLILFPFVAPIVAWFGWKLGKSTRWVIIVLFGWFCILINILT